MDLTPAAFAAQARGLLFKGVYEHSIEDAVDAIAAALGAVCDAARAESAKELAQERWQHAACLSIAEGAPGWKEVSQRETSSVAMRVVGNLRTAYLERVEEVRQLREALAEEVGRSEYCDWCRMSETGELCIPHRLLAATEPSHG